MIVYDVMTEEKDLEWLLVPIYLPMYFNLLGIVVGIVFLVVTILFQYFNFTADSNVSVFALLQLFNIFPCIIH